MSVSLIQDSLRRKNEQSPQYDYMWRVELPSVGDSVIDSTSAGTVNPRSQEGFFGQAGLDVNQTSPLSGMLDLNHRVFSIDVPFYSFEVHKANGAPGYFYTAHHRDIGTISITMDEYEDGKTLKYINDWMHAIKRNDGTYNPPAYYKKTIRYIRMSSAQFDLHVSTYKGFFLNEVAPLNATQEGDGVMQYALTLTGDKVEHKIIPKSEVVSKLYSAEQDILAREIEHNKFSVGEVDRMTTSRAFDRVVDAVL